MTLQLPHFWCLFLSCQQLKNTENWAAVTSLGSFLFCDNFSRCQINGEDFINFCDLLKKHKLYGIHFLSVGHLYFILFCFQKKFLQFLQYLTKYLCNIKQFLALSLRIQIIISIYTKSTHGICHKKAAHIFLYINTNMLTSSKT